MDEIITCPLGSKCTEIKDNKIHRCAWHIKMKGVDAAGEEHDEWGCAIAWQPILQLEIAGTNRGVAESVQSMRNENTKRQDAAIDAIKGAGNARIINTK
jgi:hypothetical protein